MGAETRHSSEYSAQRGPRQTIPLPVDRRRHGSWSASVSGRHLVPRPRASPAARSGNRHKAGNHGSRWISARQNPTLPEAGWVERTARTYLACGPGFAGTWRRASLAATMTPPIKGPFSSGPSPSGPESRIHRRWNHNAGLHVKAGQLPEAEGHPRRRKLAHDAHSRLLMAEKAPSTSTMRAKHAITDLGRSRAAQSPRQDVAAGSMRDPSGGAAWPRNRPGCRQRQNYRSARPVANGSLYIPPQRSCADRQHQRPWQRDPADAGAKPRIRSARWSARHNTAVGYSAETPHGAQHRRPAAT